MKLSVLGGGTWGLALAQVLCDNGHDVTVYARKAETVRALNETHTVPAVFARHRFPDALCATDDPKRAVMGRDALVLAVPTASLDAILTEIAPYLERDTVLINTAKGFDRRALLLPLDAICAVLPQQPAVSLIGPSHAEEVVERRLTGICVAGSDPVLCENVQQLFSNDYLRVYTCADPVGAEVGAAVKNVIALAAGMSDGLGIGGDNAKAALVSRGICEILRYGLAKGAKKETFFGLTGVGDLIVTCFSIHSRNYRAGLQIGQADSAKDFLENNRATVEGIFSCRVIAEDAAAHGIEMPLVQAVYEVLFCGASPSQKVREVMLRPLKEE